MIDNNTIQSYCCWYHYVAVNYCPAHTVHVKFSLVCDSRHQNIPEVPRAGAGILSHLEIVQRHTYIIIEYGMKYGRDAYTPT